jgi:hypothetical protein
MDAKLERKNSYSAYSASKNYTIYPLKSSKQFNYISKNMFLQIS